MKNILILGSGAREHALAVKFYESGSCSNIHVLPGNDGIKRDFFTMSIATDSFDDIYSYITLHNIDIVFVGSEQFLADGIVDFLQNKNVAVIGPTQSASKIESSKIFAKNLMKKYHIPTANYATFSDISDAILYIQSHRYPLVIKADGLAAGKGVVIAHSISEAQAYIHEILCAGRFGVAGEQIVIEDFLCGEEASIFAFCDGESFVSTIFSRDHKRAEDNDMGQNTGGMGAIAPVDKYAHLHEKVDNLIFAPILSAMKNEGCPFTGVLFAGLMIDGDDINVIEFNCRFGDPETQVILPLLETSLLDICDAILQKNIKNIHLRWHDTYAVSVILASIGYPQSFEVGHPIYFDRSLFSDKRLALYFAGIYYDKENDVYKNKGGRVVSVTATGDTLASAIAYAYQRLPLIKSDILRFRSDIGK
jgi:phosphoribosylamine--glycine ligase